jgi:hypothetical protein
MQNDTNSIPIEKQIEDLQNLVLFLLKKISDGEPVSAELSVEEKKSFHRILVKNFQKKH